MTKVTAAVICRDNMYFICRRENGLWEFPGGKVEPGETPEACLQRECFEELSIRIRTGMLLDSVRVLSDKYKPLEILFYSAWILEGEPIPSVHTALRFVPEAELDEYRFCEADRIFLEKRLAEKERKP